MKKIITTQTELPHVTALRLSPFSLPHAVSRPRTKFQKESLRPRPDARRSPPLLSVPPPRTRLQTPAGQLRPSSSHGVPRAPDWPRGLIFAPGDADLITIYLQREISGSPLPAATARYIHNLDVYAAEPAALVTGLLSASARNDGEGREWYFFTSVRAKSSRDTRRCRAVAGGVGTWHSEKARCGVLDGGGAVVGYRQSFTYEPKNGWLMLEFSQEDPRRGEAMPVLCKIYQKRRAGRSASKPISSGSSSMSGSKRKVAAADADERSGEGSSARVRRCLQFRPPPAAPNPPTLVASSEIQKAFLLPVERPQAEQEPEEPQEPPVRIAPTATPLIPSFSMTARKPRPDLRPHHLPPPRPRLTHASEFGPERHVDGTTGQLRVRLTSHLRANLLQCHNTLER